MDSVPSTYAKTAYKRLSFAQRIFVSQLVSLCFHVLLCRDWTLFFVWNMRLHDAARDVGFPPLLVYVLRKDRFAVCCLEGRLRQTLLGRVVTALYPIQPLFVDDLWCCINKEKAAPWSSGGVNVYS